MRLRRLARTLAMSAAVAQVATPVLAEGYYFRPRAMVIERVAPPEPSAPLAVGAEGAADVEIDEGDEASLRVVATGSATYANGASYPVGVAFGRMVAFDRVHVHTAVQGKIQARENGTWVEATAGSGYPIASGTNGVVTLRRAFAATEVRFVPNGSGLVYELRAGGGAAVDLR